MSDDWKDNEYSCKCGKSFKIEDYRPDMTNKKIGLNHIKHYCACGRITFFNVVWDMDTLNQEMLDNSLKIASAILAMPNLYKRKLDNAKEID